MKNNPDFLHLSEIAYSLVSHPKNDPIDDLWLERSIKLKAVEILAVLIYTGTDIQGNFRWEMITHQPGDTPTAPWLIAAPDCSRSKTLDDVPKGHSSKIIGSTGERFSVYDNEEDARAAIENCLTFKKVKSSKGREFRVQYIKLVLSRWFN